MRWAAGLLALAMCTPALAVPQMPLATARIESVLPLIAAAHKCGIVSIRSEQRSRGRVSVLVNEEPEGRSAYNCREAWVAKDPHALGLRLGHP